MEIKSNQTLEQDFSALNLLAFLVLLVTHQSLLIFTLLKIHSGRFSSLLFIFFQRDVACSKMILFEMQ